MLKRVGAAALALAAAGCATLGIRDRSELVAEPQVCANTTVPVYFRESEAGLTGEAAELIRTTARALGGCDIRRVRVLGLASATGGEQRNLTLSERRAQVVAQALAEAGWPVPSFELFAAGEAGAVTEAGEREPIRRRVEVIVEAEPRE